MLRNIYLYARRCATSFKYRLSESSQLFTVIILTYTLRKYNLEMLSASSKVKWQVGGQVQTQTQADGRSMPLTNALCTPDSFKVTVKEKRNSVYPLSH